MGVPGGSCARVSRARHTAHPDRRGCAHHTRDLLCRLDEPTGYLNLLRDHLDSAAGIYAYRERHDMRRMILSDFHPRTAVTGILSIADRGDIENLYATGSGGGLAFAPFGLETGFFRGVRIDGRLTAVAGVHVVSRNEGVAGVGNIFTHPDYRGGGLAQTVTSAVVTALLDAGIQTMVSTSNKRIQLPYAYTNA